MKKYLALFLALAMVSGVAVAQDDNETIHLPDVDQDQVPDDIGQFTADHPLHIVERGLDSVQVTVGLANQEDIAEKRTAEAVELADREDVEEEQLQKAIDRVSQSMENLPEEAQAEPLQRIEQGMNDISNKVAEKSANNGFSEEFSNNVGDVTRDVSERAGQVIPGEGEVTYVTDVNEITVEGYHTAPTSGFEVEEITSTVDEENNTVDITVDIENEPGVVSQVLTDVEFEETITVEEGDYEVNLEVFRNGDLQMDTDETVNVPTVEQVSYTAEATDSGEAEINPNNTEVNVESDYLEIEFTNNDPEHDHNLRIGGEGTSTLEEGESGNFLYNIQDYETGDEIIVECTLHDQMESTIEVVNG